MKFRLFSVLLLCVPMAVRGQVIATVTPPCSGEIAIVRTSELTGPMKVFVEAAADNQRWYRERGVATNRFVTAPVYESKGETLVQDTTKVMTFHINPPSRIPPRDSAWANFSTKYASVSKILTQTIACVPKGM